jgi:hypothetical protein
MMGQRQILMIAGSFLKGKIASIRPVAMRLLST